jgi:hypothetical protein
MKDILGLLTPTQWIVLGCGVLMLILGSKDYVVSNVKSLFDNKQEVTPKPTTNTDLTSIVAKWEILSNACKQANLLDAYNKLQEVFPMLVSVYTLEKNRKTIDEK